MLKFKALGLNSSRFNNERHFALAGLDPLPAQNPKTNLKQV